MNILILTNKPPYPAKDGSSLATLNMALGLAKAGNSVKILAITTQKHQCSIEDIPVELQFLIDFHLVKINTRISIFKGLVNLFFSNLPYNIERFIDKRFGLKLEEILNQNKFDLVQIEGLYLYPYIETIQRLTNAPIIYRSHNIEHEIWARISKNEKNWFKAGYFSLLSKRILNLEKNIVSKVNALVSISNRDNNWFETYSFTKPSITIPMGYSVSLDDNFKAGLANNDICYLGSLDWIPNQEGLNWFINEVWPIVQLKSPYLKFHVAGRNTPNSIIDKLNKVPNVVFHGEVDSAQIYLNNFSILVVPILSGSGMRVKIVEGMMLGKAVVTTTIGIEGIKAENREHAIIADSPSDFAKSIIELTQLPGLKERIVEKARIFALANFENATLTNELVDFYKKLI
jgi:glycosyltransferase involved in cell wall biosynthesis